MDDLSALMRHLHLETRVFHRSEHCGTWVLDADYERKAMFHLVAAGECVMQIGESRREIPLAAGDTVMFARPASHRVISAWDAGKDATTLLLCGYFEFASPLATVLLASLPTQVVLRKGSDGGDAASLLTLIMREAATEAPGSTAIMDKLADALFIQVLRHCLLHGQVRHGVLGTLKDPHLAEALLVMHQDPAADWTLDKLARRVHMSRATFARHFASVVGMPPMAYLTWLRMQAAHEALTERRVTVAQASEIAGYATDAAFSRAFKHAYGYSPGSLRVVSFADIHESSK
ncbi:MAG: AraC family transcriptional regulator [Xanthomonadaceae bacterium]|nr:AraC family transcriptional regulator [Xanthomonadaceae bacterium]TAN03269.1 MAG: AraC family transcriptional regulator [Rhodanobacteraceae bacterium]